MSFSFTLSSTDSGSELLLGPPSPGFSEGQAHQGNSLSFEVKQVCLQVLPLLLFTCGTLISILTSLAFYMWKETYFPGKFWGLNEIQCMMCPAQCQYMVSALFMIVPSPQFSPMQQVCIECLLPTKHSQTLNKHSSCPWQDQSQPRHPWTHTPHTQNDFFFHPEMTASVGIVDAVQICPLGPSTFPHVRMLAADTWQLTTSLECSLSCYVSFPGTVYIQWLIDTGCKVLPPIPQFGTMLQSHPSSRATCGVAWGIPWPGVNGFSKSQCPHPMPIIC